MPQIAHLILVSWRTHRVIRAILLVGGALTAVGFIAAAAYYHSHEHIHVVLGDLATIARDIEVDVDRLDPSRNSRERLKQFRVGVPTEYGFIMPASDLLISINAHYNDGAPRVINFHLNNRPQWQWTTKRITLTVPASGEVRPHPNMAYIPAVVWLAGAERTPALNYHPYWIDIAPATVQEFLPIALQNAAKGTIPRDESVLLHEIDSSPAAATGTTQLLNNPRAGNAAEHPIVRDDAAALLARLHSACRTCPAPMTLDEARAYCEGRHMRLPIRSEWELAARGTDGRAFPWGETWNDAYGNAGPDAGKLTTLRPSNEFAAGASPYGAIDLVGNAGDWIETEGAHEQAFMGGVYVFNREDCTVFAKTPDTGDVLPRFQVTCRCISRPDQPVDEHLK